MTTAAAVTGCTGGFLQHGFDLSDLQVREHGETVYHQWGESVASKEIVTLGELIDGHYGCGISIVAARILAEGGLLHDTCEIVRFVDKSLREVWHNGTRYYSRSRRIYTRRVS